MKFTAPTKERHDIWLNVHLLSFVLRFSSNQRGFYRPSNTCSRGRAVCHFRRGWVDRTAQIRGQVPQHSAPCLGTLNSLWTIVNMGITTLNYWPAPKALEAGAVFILVATLGAPPVARASEVRHSSQLVAPLASVRVHRLPNIYDTQARRGRTVRRSLMSRVALERRKSWNLSSTMRPCQIKDSKVWKMCELAVTDYTQSAEIPPNTTRITTTTTTTIPTETIPPPDAPACETDT